MTRVAPALLLLLLLCMGPEAQGAAEAGEHGPAWGMLALQTLNILVLALVLVRFTRKPIQDFLLQRSDGIRKQIHAAQGRLREAQAELEELRGRVASLEAEASRLLEESSRDAEAERARALERARAAAERIREEARRLAEHEVERARRELQAEAAELAVKLAGDLLRENLGPDDDRRLVSEYIERVGDRQ